MTDAQATGRAARTKGIRAELQLAKYLRTWWPHAERAVVTGFRAGTHVSPDHGDIRGAGNLVWQCKHLATMTDKQIDDALEATRNQAYAAKAAYGIFVQRRQGKTDPAKWWAWLTLTDCCALASPGSFCVGDGVRFSYAFSGYRMPLVRMQLGDVVDLLLDVGLGEVNPWQTTNVRTAE